VQNHNVQTSSYVGRTIPVLLQFASLLDILVAAGTSYIAPWTGGNHHDTKTTVAALAPVERRFVVEDLADIQYGREKRTKAF